MLPCACGCLINALCLGILSINLYAGCLYSGLILLHSPRCAVFCLCAPPTPRLVFTPIAVSLCSFSVFHQHLQCPATSPFSNIVVMQSVGVKRPTVDELLPLAIAQQRTFALPHYLATTRLRWSERTQTGHLNVVSAVARCVCLAVGKRLGFWNATVDWGCLGDRFWALAVELTIAVEHLTLSQHSN